VDGVMEQYRGREEEVVAMIRRSQVPVPGTCRKTGRKPAQE
jgi:hypothetical protein